MNVLIKFLYYLTRSFPNIMHFFGALSAEALMVIGIRKNVVIKNLKIAFPGRSIYFYDILFREIYRHFFFQTVETVYYYFFPEKLIKKAELRGREILENAVKSGRQIFYYTGHLGFWELIPVYIKRFFRTAVVLYQKIRDRDVNDFMLKFRSRSGGIFIERRKSLDIIRHLKSGYDIGMLVDQRPIEKGISVEFFGRPTKFYFSSFKIAEKFNGFPVFIFSYKEGKKIVFEASECPAADAAGMAKAYVAKLEKMIRLYPSQYFWLHNRWKYG